MAFLLLGGVLEEVGLWDLELNQEVCLLNDLVKDCLELIMSLLIF